MGDLVEKQTQTVEMVTTKEEADFKLLQRKAMVMQQSGWFGDCQSAAQAVAKALLGAEFGLAPAMAMSNVQVVKGNPSLKYIALGALVKKSGRYWWQIKPKHRRNESGHLVPDAEGNPIVEGFHSDDRECVIEFFRIAMLRDGTKKHIKFAEESFTIEDAAREGLASRPNYKSMPKLMLRARCLSRGVNMHCSDVLGGAAYVPEDFGFSSDDTAQPHQPQEVEAKPVKKQKKKKIAPKKKAAKPAKDVAPPQPDSPTELDEEFQRQMAKDEAKEPEITDAEFEEVLRNPPPSNSSQLEIESLPF